MTGIFTAVELEASFGARQPLRGEWPVGCAYIPDTSTSYQTWIKHGFPIEHMRGQYLDSCVSGLLGCTAHMARKGPAAADLCNRGRTQTGGRTQQQVERL